MIWSLYSITRQPPRLAFGLSDTVEEFPAENSDFCWTLGKRWDCSGDYSEAQLEAKMALRLVYLYDFTMGALLFLFSVGLRGTLLSLAARRHGEE